MYSAFWEENFSWLSEYILSGILLWKENCSWQCVYIYVNFMFTVEMCIFRLEKDDL